jgi:hypothetical protein
MVQGSIGSGLPNRGKLSKPDQNQTKPNFGNTKSKGRDVLDDAARELATVFDDLEDDDMDLNDDVADLDGGGNKDSGEGDEDIDDSVVDDDDDGLPDEREGMSEEELANLEKSMKPVRLVLTKVRHIN